LLAFLPSLVFDRSVCLAMITCVAKGGGKLLNPAGRPLKNDPF
jgi:hypothetical protein